VALDPAHLQISRRQSECAGDRRQRVRHRGGGGQIASHPPELAAHEVRHAIARALDLIDARLCDRRYVLVEPTEQASGREGGGKETCMRHVAPALHEPYHMWAPVSPRT